MATACLVVGRIVGPGAVGKEVGVGKKVGVGVGSVEGFGLGGECLPEAGIKEKISTSGESRVAIYTEYESVCHELQPICAGQPPLGVPIA